jgi:hypothetical protein
MTSLSSLREGTRWILTGPFSQDSLWWPSTARPLQYASLAFTVQFDYRKLAWPGRLSMCVEARYEREIRGKGVTRSMR